MTEADREFIRQNSIEIQEGTGESIVRKRLDTTLPPASYDENFGEVGTKAEETYLELELTGKVLELTEELMLTDFGGSVDADADVHVPFAADVVTGDFLVIRSQWYSVGPVKESALKSYLACAVTKTAARVGSSVAGSGGVPVPHWAHAADIGHLSPDWYTFKTWDMGDFYSDSYYLVGCRVSCGTAADGEWKVRVTATGIGVADKVWEVVVAGGATAANLEIRETLDVAEYRSYAIAACLSGDIGDQNPKDADVEVVSRAQA